MIKILEWSQTPNHLRRKFWTSDRLSGVTIGWEEHLTSDPVFWQRKDLAAILVSSEFADVIKANLNSIPQEVLECDSFDVLVYDKRWWPRITLREAIRELIVAKTPKLDTQSVAYVSGLGGNLRASIATLVQMGFKKIKLISDAEQKSEEIAKLLNRKFFGTEITVLGNQEIIRQPNHASVLINNLNFDHPLQKDLSFLNFLRPGGLVIDLNFVDREHSLLLAEAEQSGFQTVDGLELSLLCDWHLFKRIGLNPSLSGSQVLEEWGKFRKLDDGPVTNKSSSQ